MSTIVLHKPTDKKFILIGTVYEIQNKPNHLEPLYGSLNRSKNRNGEKLAAVCDSNGNISYLASEELIVLEIDGVSPGLIIV